mmetsp:Transcript_11144/g.24316  ORF Transcript_11144/g.24316 Transcript_11144/m.24316 type:complete len:367 (-) Transcript_11144:630-1730(-)
MVIPLPSSSCCARVSSEKASLSAAEPSSSLEGEWTRQRSCGRHVTGDCMALSWLECDSSLCSDLSELSMMEYCSPAMACPPPSSLFPESSEMPIARTAQPPKTQLISCASISWNVARQSSPASVASTGVILGHLGRQPGDCSAESIAQLMSMVKYICKKHAAAASATSSMEPSHAKGSAMTSVKAVARCGSWCTPESRSRPMDSRPGTEPPIAMACSIRGATSRHEMHEPMPTTIVPKIPTYLCGHALSTKASSSSWAGGADAAMVTRMTAKMAADVSTEPMAARGTETYGVRSSPALFTGCRMPAKHGYMKVTSTLAWSSDKVPLGGSRFAWRLSRLAVCSVPKRVLSRVTANTMSTTVPTVCTR